MATHVGDAPKHDLSRILDSRQIARALGFIYISGPLISLVWLLLPHTRQANDLGILATILAALLLGLVLASGWCDNLPRWAFSAVVSTATIAVSVGIYFTHRYDAGGVLLYLWATPYAYAFFSLRQAILQTTWVGIAMVVVFSLAAFGWRDWAGTWLLTMGTIVIVGLLVRRLARDVSERQLQEEALRIARDQAENANAAKNEFLSRVSHELRTPLTAIIGFGELLELEDLNAQQRIYVQTILRGGNHLLSLINDVLDIAKIESRDNSLVLEPVLLSDIVAEVIDLIHPLASARRITVETQFKVSANCTVSADPQRLKQVLLNIVSNAVKYNIDRGRITLKIEALSSQRIRISVVDTGRGISAPAQEKLFTPFERLDVAQFGIDGTGLGLALSRSLTEAMGGTMGVTSVLNEGSTFWIELDIAQTPVVSRPQVATDSGLRTYSRPKTVLYIEDTLSNLRLVERVVARRPSVHLVVAMRGTLGVELADRHYPDLILLDLNLPDVAGVDVLRQLHANSATEDIPIVVVSADATSQQIDTLLAAGAVKYMTKPIRVQALLDVLDEILGEPTVVVTNDVEVSRNEQN